jgi:hypothetical protein
LAIPILVVAVDRADQEVHFVLLDREDVLDARRLAPQRGVLGPTKGLTVLLMGNSLGAKFLTL